MLRIRLYTGSQAVENYLNKMSEKGYELKSITFFGLFVPIRMDAYSFMKTKHSNRTYQVDSRHVDSADMKDYIQTFSDDGWTYFKGNYANDEFTKNRIFYSDDPTKSNIYSDPESKFQRNRQDALSSLYKGAFLFLVFLACAYLFPVSVTSLNDTFLGFILHNIYLLTAVTIILVSLYRYVKNRQA